MAKKGERRFLLSGKCVYNSGILEMVCEKFFLYYHHQVPSSLSPATFLFSLQILRYLYS